MFTQIVTASFFIYVAYVAYSFWSLVKPPTCANKNLCIPSYLNKSPNLHLQLFTSVRWDPRSSDVTPVNIDTIFKYDEPFERKINVNVPYNTRKNGTMFLHLFVSKIKNDWNGMLHDPESVHISVPLTRYYIPDVGEFRLLNISSFPIEDIKPVTHIKEVISFYMMTDRVSFSKTELPSDIYNHLRISRNREFLPIMLENFLIDISENLKELKRNVTEKTIILKYEPIGYGQLRFLLQLQLSINSMHYFGFKDKEIDDMKSLIANTNLYFLIGTLTVATIHILFDFLAYKNDISFWRTRKTLTGLSARTIIWHAFSQTVIVLYLYDEKASLLILIPSVIGLIIEVWKVQKLIPVDWRKMRLKKLKLTASETKTREFDAQSVKYLSYAFYPLCICAAVYSLLHDNHRSWYSWVLRSLVNGVYAFGFLFMLPQLFINYKLKSVAHLPWRTFMYKAFNTFIDDVFAFIITMPASHRLACFRDDVVFIIYMIQRWMYPVDKCRIDDETSITEDTTDIARTVAVADKKTQ